MSMQVRRSILFAGALGVAALCNQEDAAPAVRIEHSLETGKSERAQNNPSSRPRVPSLPTRKHTAQAISAALEDFEDTDSSQELGAPTELDLYQDDLLNELKAYRVEVSFSQGWLMTDEFLFRVQRSGNGEVLFVAQRRTFPAPMVIIQSHAPTPEELVNLLFGSQETPAEETQDSGSF